MGCIRQRHLVVNKEGVSPLNRAGIAYRAAGVRDGDGRGRRRELRPVVEILGGGEAGLLFVVIEMACRAIVVAVPGVLSADDRSQPCSIAVPAALAAYRQAIALPFDLALLKAGRSNPARMAMIAITTKSSISVNALRLWIPIKAGINVIAIERVTGEAGNSQGKPNWFGTVFLPSFPDSKMEL